MVISDAIKGYPALMDVNSNLLEKVCIERGIVSSDTFTADKSRSVNLCVADLYMEMSVSPDVTDGDFSRKYSSEWLQNRANQIYKMYGDAKGNINQPIIRNETRQW